MADDLDDLDVKLRHLLAAEARHARALRLASAGPCDRCEALEVVEWADEMCTGCGHVPLCVECSWLHVNEARADGTLRPNSPAT